MLPDLLELQCESHQQTVDDGLLYKGILQECRLNIWQKNTYLKFGHGHLYVKCACMVSQQ